MNILVTGATGTVGNQVVEKLNEKGIFVRALSRMGNGFTKPGVQHVMGDLNIPEAF